MGFGGVPATRRGTWLPERKSNSRRAAPLRRDRLEGLHAARPAGEARRVPDRRDTPAAPTEGTRAAPKRGRADSTGAGASVSASARDIAGGWLACGPHNAGRMRAAQCGTHANVRTDRWGERDRSCGQRHQARHGHGQGHDVGTGSDAFGITSFYIRPFPFFVPLFIFTGRKGGFQGMPFWGWGVVGEGPRVPRGSPYNTLYPFYPTLS